MIPVPDPTKPTASPTGWLLSVIWPHENPREQSWTKPYRTQEEALRAAAVVKADTSKMNPGPDVTVQELI